MRPVREVAAAIEDQNLEELIALPGIGPAVAERIVAKLRRRMARFALMVARDIPSVEGTPHNVVDETFQALVNLGHTAADARKLIDSVAQQKKKFKSADQLLIEIYRIQRRATRPRAECVRPFCGHYCGFAPSGKCSSTV